MVLGGLREWRAQGWLQAEGPFVILEQGWKGGETAENTANALLGHLGAWSCCDQILLGIYRISRARLTDVG